MKNLLISFSLLCSLLVFGLFTASEITEAQNDVLPALLDLPAPPPPNPLIKSRKRGENFFSKKNPPDDNAPIDELLDYWRTQSAGYEELGYNIKPGERALERILNEIENDPEKLVEFINILPEKPEVADLVKRIYDQKSADENEENEENYRWHNVESWLRLHSRYYTDELLSAAQEVADTEVGYVTNQEELLALARLDWDRAKPILERLYSDSSQPVSQTLARWAFYRHALETDSSGDIERYRDELRADVENKSASHGRRDLALDALIREKDWNGRDDWYFSLLEDETLADLRVGGQSYTGLTTMLLYAPPEKYAEKMLELVKSGNPAIRNAAVRNLGTLLDEGNIEVVKALLPWLENAAWATEHSDERQKLINALQKFELPESVPGLIALLDEKTLREVPDYSSNPNSNMMGTMTTMSNVMVMNAPMKPMSNSARTVGRVIEYLKHRDSAILALANQKDSRAAPALRRILPEVPSYQRLSVIRALLLSNGFSISEQVEALETFAKAANQEADAKNALMEAERKALVEETIDLEVSTTTNSMVANSSIDAPIDQSVIKSLLGGQIVSNSEPGEELISALVRRIGILDKSDPPLANLLRRIMLNWNGAGIKLMMLDDLKNGKSDATALVKILADRKVLREEHQNAVYAARNGNPTAYGIAACVLENPNDYATILSNENVEVKTAFLGCARLIRAELPVRTVAQNLESPNKLLALAAERYLESEDSPKARQIILAKYPNEARILGATTYFGEKLDFSTLEFASELFKSVNDLPWLEQSYLFYGEKEKIQNTEKKLQKEIKESAELVGVYAYDDNFIRIYNDKTVFSYAENNSRYRERVLTRGEFDHFKNYLADGRVDELVPFLTECEDCAENELLMLGRQGGRRIYHKGYKNSEFFNGLDKIFEEMRKPPAKLRYDLEKSVAGLEILFADEDVKAEAVWKSGGDLRVLTSDSRIQKQVEKDLSRMYEESGEEIIDYRKFAQMRAERMFDHLSWRKFADGKFAEQTAAPPNFNFPPRRENFPVRAAPDQWKARAANAEYRADDTGLYKISGGKLSKIREGFYQRPIVTPDGRWLMVGRYGTETGFEIIRINLMTNREFKINKTGFSPFLPLAALSTGKHILVSLNYYGRYDSETERAGSNIFYTVNVETGTIERVKGEFRPLAQQVLRPLQPTEHAGESWAAIYDGKQKATDIGRYDEKTFTFKSVLRIPEIALDSMNIWVDEKESKVYFVYQGHLLSLPLPKRENAK